MSFTNHELDVLYIALLHALTDHPLFREWQGETNSDTAEILLHRLKVRDLENAERATIFSTKGATA